MTIVSDVYTINIRNDASRGLNDASKSVIEDFTEMLQIVASNFILD
jgi:hypothetical protein